MTSFNMKNGSMTLGVNVHAPDGTKIEWKLGGWEIFGIIMACLLIVVVIAVAIYCCVKHQQKKKRRQMASVYGRDYSQINQ